MRQIIDTHTVEQYKPRADSFEVERTAYVAPVIDYAHALREAGAAKSRSGDFTHVASIPPIVIDYWLKARGLTMRDWMHDPSVKKRFLNDPDYSLLRVWKGTV